jgi:hypothetical protein
MRQSETTFPDASTERMRTCWRARMPTAVFGPDAARSKVRLRYANAERM